MNRSLHVLSAALAPFLILIASGCTTAAQDHGRSSQISKTTGAVTQLDDLPPIPDSSNGGVDNPFPPPSGPSGYWSFDDCSANSTVLRDSRPGVILFPGDSDFDAEHALGG